MLLDGHNARMAAGLDEQNKLAGEDQTERVGISSSTQAPWRRRLIERSGAYRGNAEAVRWYGRPLRLKIDSVRRS
ncbi:MAG TPA: hypothetical protein VI320_24420 [Terracidiphilus sp.]